MSRHKKKIKAIDPFSKTGGVYPEDLSKFNAPPPKNYNMNDDSGRRLSSRSLIVPGWKSGGKQIQGRGAVGKGAGNAATGSKDLTSSDVGAPFELKVEHGMAHLKPSGATGTNSRVACQVVILLR